MRALALASLGLVAACSRGPDAPVAERLYTMGTFVDIEIVAEDRERARAAIDDAAAMLTRFERDYYAWADGELAALNRALAAGRAFEADAALVRVLEAARDVARRSGGHFDPAVGGLVELWGFHTADATPAAPPDAAIAAWLERRASIRGLAIDKGLVSHESTGLTLDLGGIAKGEAVDRVVDIVERRGLGRALVNAGGDVRVVGTRGDRRWRIGVRAPRAEGLLGIIELEPGEAVFTSGDYERFFIHDGRRMHHILDPRTGRPVQHTQAVTVIAPDGLTADAAATALLVAGPDEWRAVAEALGISAALRVDASGRVELTPAMRDRFQAVSGAAPDIMAPGQ